MEWSLLAAALLLILLFNTNQSCDVSNLISFIQDIRTCNNSILVISFNFTNATCASYEYQIELIHLHTQEIKRSTQNPKPFLYNGTNICHISLTLTDNVTAEEYYNSSLHVRVDKYPSCFLSNNFTVSVDKDPPGSFLIYSAVYCNEVYLFWSTPPSPPACPIKSYEIKFNDTTIITNKTYHHFTELPASQSMSVSVGATNDIGTSWNSTLITTAIAPVVSMVNHTVELIQMNSTSLTACLSITAKVFTHCLYSLPTHINLSLSCDDTYYHTITSSILSVNGLIEYNYKKVPVDMLYCTAKAVWYNLNSSTAEYTFNFNTSQFYMKIFPVSNGLHYTCYYREHSIVWGCGISVNNNASNTTQRNGSSVTEGCVTSLCPGTSYNVMMYYILSSKDRKHVIGFMNVSVNGSTCTSPGAGGVGERSHTMTYVAVIVSVVVIVALLVVIGVLIKLFVKKKRLNACISRFKRKVTIEESIVFDGSSAHVQNTEPVGTAFKKDDQIDGRDVCNDESEDLIVTPSPPQPPHHVQESSETQPCSPTHRESTDQGQLHFATNQPFTRASASGLRVIQHQRSQESNKSNKSLTRIASKISQKVSSILSFHSGGSGYQQLSQDDELSTIHSERLHDPGDVPPSTDTGVSFMIGGGGEDND